jgi:hypothetical protein
LLARGEFKLGVSPPALGPSSSNTQLGSLLGDLGWYSMRAVVEYLRPKGQIRKVATFAEREPETTTVVRASGLIAFGDGAVSTFDLGFTAGVPIMDLQLLGTSGVFKGGEVKDEVVGLTSKADLISRLKTLN